MLPTSRARAAAALIAVSLAGVLVLPGVALADPASHEDPAAHPAQGERSLPDPALDHAAQRAHDVVGQRPGATPDDEAADDPVDEPVGEDEDSDDGSDDTDGAPRTALPAPTIELLPPATCTPHLVTFTPERTDGDDTAVAITSQALDVEVAGWVQVSWQAAADTELTAIELVRTDGTRTALEVSATGTASDVLALTFCGTVEASAGSSRSIAGSDDTTDGAAEDAEGTAADDGAGDDADATSGRDGATGGDPADDVSDGSTTDDTVAPGDEPDEVEVTDTRPEQPATTVTTASTPAAGDGASTAADADVEVLGVQIVAPPRARDTEDADPADGVADAERTAPIAATPRLADLAGESGGMHPLLLAAAVAAGLIAAVTVLRGPGRERTGRRTTTSTAAAGGAGTNASTTGGPA